MQVELTQDEVFRYARHLTIPEVGLEGQKKLKQAAVLIVGTGGLGSPIALYLAAAGVGRIGLVDFDVVDVSNLQRQVIHDTQQIGKRKVDSARQRMLSINPLIEVDTYPEAFTYENAMKIASQYDLLLDACDNFATRYLMNDVCVLTGKPYIYGSIFQFEGQASVFDARSGPCYRCLFSDPPPTLTVPHGVQAGVFGVLPGTIGTIEASEALKILMGIGAPLIGQLVLYDALEMAFHRVQIKKNPACKVCGTRPEITEITDRYTQYMWQPAFDVEAEFRITPRELYERIQSEAPPYLLDVRDAAELKISQISGSVNLPLAVLSSRINEIPKDREVVVFSRLGVRSSQAFKILREAGFTRLKWLEGGVNAWVKEIEPNQYQY